MPTADNITIGKMDEMRCKMETPIHILHFWLEGTSYSIYAVNLVKLVAEGNMSRTYSFEIADNAILFMHLELLKFFKND